MPKKNKRNDSMPVDLFEKEYAEQISWQTEIILGNGPTNGEDYDAAYEQAVEEVAKEKGITLL